MNEIKTSAFLTQLIEYAKNDLGEKNAPFTAERFFLAILDKMLKEENETDDAEFATLSQLMSSKINSLRRAKRVLQSYIFNKKGSPILDDLYMKKSFGKPL